MPWRKRARAGLNKRRRSNWRLFGISSVPKRPRNNNTQKNTKKHSYVFSCIFRLPFCLFLPHPHRRNIFIIEIIQRVIAFDFILMVFVVLKESLESLFLSGVLSFILCISLEISIFIKTLIVCYWTSKNTKKTQKT